MMMDYVILGCLYFVQFVTVIGGPLLVASCVGNLLGAS